MIKRKIVILGDKNGLFSQELHSTFLSLGRTSNLIQIDEEGEGNLDYLLITTPPMIGEEHYRLYERMSDLAGAIIVAPNHLSGLRSLLFCKEVRIAVLGLVGEEALAVKLDLPYLGREEEVSKIGTYLDTRMEFYG
ncbi:MAG: hypothetical protein ACOXZ2_03960 [Sphaerochaetaceae bacterium]